MSADRASRRPRPARRATPAGLLALTLCAAAAPARADVLDVTVSTLLQGRADPRDGQVHTIVPVYESVSALLTVRRPYTDGIRVVFSGWGGLILDIPKDQRWDGDVDLGYVEGAFQRRRFEVRLGRQLLSGGAARIAQMDGLSASVRLFRGLHLSGYGGAPVTPRFGTHRGDVIVGGRMFYRASIDTEVGVSFNQINDQGRIARQDLGVDARYVPHQQVALTGTLLYALPEARLAEATAAVRWQPRRWADVSLEYRRTAPDLYLPLNSVFAVFSQETRDEVGGAFYVQPLRRLRLNADYRYLLNQDGPGHRGGGKVAVSLGPRDHTTLVGEVRVLKVPSNGYVQARLYSVHHLTPKIMAMLNGDLYLMDRAINGLSYSLTGAATLAFELGGGFRLVTTGIAEATPFVERHFEFVFRLAYNATRRFHEVHP